VDSLRVAGQMKLVEMISRTGQRMKKAMNVDIAGAAGTSNG